MTTWHPIVFPNGSIDLIPMDAIDRAFRGELDRPQFPLDPDDCEHGRWNPDNGQCLDCGDMTPLAPYGGRGAE